MRTLILLISLITSQVLVAQNTLTVGVGSTSSALKSLIEAEGLNIQAHKYEEINAKTLVDKDIVALFNLRQTWDQQLTFSQEQSQALIDFVEKGGILYLTARKSYSNLLVQLGVVLTGNDGGPTGRDWPLIMEKSSKFEDHPITEGLSSIQTDVSARFELDKNWKVLAQNNEGTPMLAIRQFGAGQIILGAGERIFRDPRPTNNRYETDIHQADNYQYHLNLFRYLKNPKTKTEVSQPHQNNEHFQIFPNPTSQDVTIIGKNILSIDIIDLQGKILRQEQFSKETQVILNCGDLVPGLYFLKIHSNQGISVEELVIK
jgi:hypothetical protein